MVPEPQVRSRRRRATSLDSTMSFTQTTTGQEHENVLVADTPVSTTPIDDDAEVSTMLDFHDASDSTTIEETPERISDTIETSGGNSEAGFDANGVVGTTETEAGFDTNNDVGTSSNSPVAGFGDNFTVGTNGPSEAGFGVFDVVGTSDHSGEGFDTNDVVGTPDQSEEGFGVSDVVGTTDSTLMDPSEDNAGFSTPVKLS